MFAFYTVVYLSSFLANFGLGLLVYFKNKKSKLNKFTKYIEILIS